MANALARGERAPALHLEPKDFEIHDVEDANRAATVLLVDMSRSMLLRGCFRAAKRVTMALNSLMKGQFPRDNLEIIGFSYIARELKPEDLPSLTLNEWEYGTNMQHALMLARVRAVDRGAYDAWLAERAAAAPDLGEQTFAGACAPCHGDKGEGLIGPALKGNPVLANRATLAALLETGKGAMPPVGRGWTMRGSGGAAGTASSGRGPRRISAPTVPRRRCWSSIYRKAADRPASEAEASAVSGMRISRVMALERASLTARVARSGARLWCRSRSSCGS